MQVKLRTNKPDDAERLLANIRALVNDHGGDRVIAHLATDAKAQVEARAREATIAHVRALAAKLGAKVPEDATAKLDRALAERKMPVPAESFEKALLAFLGSDEFIGDVPSEPADAKARVAKAAAQLGPGATIDTLSAAIANALDPKPTDAAARDLASSIEKTTAEIWRREQAAAWARGLVKDLGVTPPEGAKGDRFVTAVGSALLDLGRDAVVLPASAAKGEPLRLEIHVTGQPVINEGLSNSVTRNQVRSLGVALLLVLFITSAVFRSVRTGLLATGPALLTVAVLYASMTFLGIRLDIGTSLLASLIVGAGTDYAIHALSGWEAADDRPLAEAAARSAQVAGQGIWTNALMVACGFSVLTLGDAKPLQNVGGLTAAAMVLSAFATFLIVPAFAQKRRYVGRPRMPDPPLPSDSPEAATAEGASALSSLMNDGERQTTNGAPPNSPRSR